MSFRIAALFTGYFFSAYLMMGSFASSQEPELLPLTKLGVRTIEDGKQKFLFPWYYAKADHNQFLSNKIWPRIAAVPGSKATYIGDYGMTELIEFSNEHGSLSTFEPGMQFYDSEKRRLKIGPGKVKIRHWYFDETKKDGPMRFKGRGYDYVVCLDREPESTFKFYGGDPGFNLNTELAHVIGIIELEHTYNWKELPDWKLAPINDQSLIRFRVVRRGFDLPDIRFEKGESNKHTVANRDGVAIAGDDVLNRLLYGLRSCKWRELKTPHEFSRWPTVTETQIVLSSENGQKTLTILYDSGAWVLTIGDKQYKAFHPIQLFDVRSMIEKLVKKSAEK